ncbi:hypothetical protein SSX86_010283 [Deinandra increscens subsp. villosa]|uniref:Transposase (putative) gypsy type domain-containing protein n=1 Tax=Deinandra increscens subsp. villosa TaxID=3103831 RepID=A0AAP0DCA6_9ASTR
MSLHPVLPPPNSSIFSFNDGKIGTFAEMFKFGNYRIPFTKFLVRALSFFEVHISQMHPQGLSRLSHFEVSCRAANLSPSVTLFRAFYRITMAGDWYTFERRRGVARISTTFPPNPRSWKTQLFYIDDLCIPPSMKWREIDDVVHDIIAEDGDFPKEHFDRLVDVASPIRELPEIILLISRISKAWFTPDLWLILQYSDREMELFEALSLKSFSGLDVAAKKIGEETVPFLNQTASSFYDVRPEVDPAISKNVNVVASDQEVLSIDDMYNQIVSSKGEDAPTATSSQMQPLATRKQSKRPPKPPSSKDANFSKRKSPRLVTQSSPNSNKNTFDSPEVIKDDFEEETASKPVDTPKVPPTTTSIIKLTPSSSLSYQKDFPNLRIPTSEWLKKEVELVSLRTSSAKEFQSSSAPTSFTPEWNISSDQSYQDATVAKRLSLLSSTPVDISSIHQIPHKAFSDEFMMTHAKQQNPVAGLYERWIIAEARVEELTYLHKKSVLAKLSYGALDAEVKVNTLSSEVEVLRTRNRKLVALEQEARRDLKHAQDNELYLKNQFLEQKRDLESQLVLLQEKSKDHEAYILGAKKGCSITFYFPDCGNADNNSLKEKSKWLIVEGLDLLAKRVHSEVIPMALNLNRAVNAVGFNEGIKCGLAHAAKNETDFSIFKEFDGNAQGELIEHLKSLKSMTFDIIDQVSKLDVTDIEAMKEMLKPITVSKPPPSAGK